MFSNWFDLKSPTWRYADAVYLVSRFFLEEMGENPNVHNTFTIRNLVHEKAVNLLHELGFEYNRYMREETPIPILLLAEQLLSSGRKVWPELWPSVVEAYYKKDINSQKYFITEYPKISKECGLS